MKKYLRMALFICSLGVSFAQGTNDSGTTAKNYLVPGETKTITQDLSSENTAELQKIQSRFCNDGKMTNDLKLEMRPGQRKEICITLKNTSDNPINLLWGFSEGVINDAGVPTCKADMTDKNMFAASMRSKLTTGITIPAQSNITERFRYSAPKNSSGDIFGCFGYKIDKQEQIATGEMFLIVPRKVGYIFLNITGPVYQFGRRTSIKDAYTSNKQIILKILIAIIAIRLVVTIFKTTKKQEKHHKKK